MKRLAGVALALGLLGAALLAGFIGGGDVLTAVTGNEQDSPDWVLVTVGGVFLLAGFGLAMLALVTSARRRQSPLVSSPRWCR